ncbi:hypothetical protein CPB85DRAFT_1459580 [Mucidula mucida]|nr:hypothetical protein CPB85DRAFT_1459580 [Mucidula mucida]
MLGRETEGETATAFGSSITKHARPSDDASAFWHVVFVRVGRGSKASASPALVENAMRTTVAAVSKPASRLTAFDVGHDANVGSPCNGNWPGDYQFLLHSSAVSAMRLVKRLSTRHTSVILEAPTPAIFRFIRLTNAPRSIMAFHFVLGQTWRPIKQSTGFGARESERCRGVGGASPDRSSEPGGTVPERAVHKGDLKKSTKRPRRPTQSQSAPAFIPPPPPATRPVQVPVQYQPPTMFTIGAMGPQPKPARAARRRKQSPYHRAVITPPPAASGSVQHEPPKTSTRGAMGPPVWTPSHPLEYYQYNDPTCPIPEGDLPGPRSDYLFPLWLAYQKKAKAEAEAKEEEEKARALLAKAKAEEVEVVERRVCAVKAQEIKPIAWADYTGVIDPALLALG